MFPKGRGCPRKVTRAVLCLLIPPGGDPGAGRCETQARTLSVKITSRLFLKLKAKKAVEVSLEVRETHEHWGGMPGDLLRASQSCVLAEQSGFPLLNLCCFFFKIILEEIFQKRPI